MNSFSPTQMVGKGWNLVKDNLGLTVGASFVSLVVPSIVSSLSEAMGMELLFALVSSVLSMVFSIGLIKIFLNLTNNEEASWSDLYQHYGKLLTFLGASILIGLMLIPAFILFIIPGIYLSLRLAFFGELILDQDMGIIESIKGSWELTKGHVGNIFVLGLLFIGLSLLGVLAMVLGVFVAYPVIMAAKTYAYREIQQLKK